MTHVIYYVRSGPNEELRYSLRTLAANGPDDVKLTIIGDPPEWLDRSKVTVVPGNPYTDPHSNSLYNIRLASEIEPGDYWTFNDDFFILRPWPDPFPVWYWKPVEEHYTKSMNDPKSLVRKKCFRRTLDYLRLRGIEHPNHYELHIPMKINGAEMLRILEEASEYINDDNPPIWRTLYANLSTLPSEAHVQREDVKHHLRDTVPDNLDFLSTWERTFENVAYLLDSYTEPSPWELN